MKRTIPSVNDATTYLIRLEDQLRYAVEHNNGKTTITQQDLLILKDAIYHLEVSKRINK